ncbi:hypothetical protein ACP4OV_009368 [Aristida adscensionis]
MSAPGARSPRTGEAASAPEAAAQRDRLSELPDDLLHRILRFLDARQVVSELSRLSRRWRHLWSTMPFVALRSDVYGSESFGNLLLLLRNGGVPLHTFCMHSWNWSHFRYERRWLLHALSRGLCVLEVSLNSSDRRFCLPDSVFSCATLEEISLSATVIREVIAPGSVCLPRLKKLNLDFVQFNNPSVIEKLNSGCPALEDLSLSRSLFVSLRISSDTLKTLSITDCTYKEIHVSAPNIASLRLTVSGKVQLDEMPYLVNAWVYVSDDRVEHLARGGYDLAAALCNAQHLELFRFNLKLQDMMGNSAREGLSFCKLKSLYIGEWLVTDFYNPLACFLQSAPNLITLTLDQWVLYEKHKGNVTNLVSTEKKPSAELKLVSALTRDLEMLLIRLSKGDDIGEFRKMRALLKEKTKPKETVIVWF